MGRRRATVAAAPAAERKPVGSAGTPEAAARARAGHRVYTPEEVAHHLEAVDVLLAQSASYGQVARAMQERFGVGKSRTYGLIKRVYAKWEAERAENGKHDRNRLIASIRRSIAQCEVRMAALGEAPRTNEWATLNNVKLRYQEQLMDLTGARVPEVIEHNINATVNTNILTVVATLNPEQVESYRARRRARELEEETRVSSPALPPYTSGNAE
jgi:hypothetical protein